MPDLLHASGAVEAARTVVAGEARRVPALADPVVAVPGTAFGGLAAGVLVDAVERVRAALVADLAAAGDRLDHLDRALDATGRAMLGVDGAITASLTLRR